jgi:hypothetical protein
MKRLRKLRRCNSEDKTKILQDLASLVHDSRLRPQSVLGRFIECRELQIASALFARAVDHCSLARWETPSNPRRSPATNLLIAPPCELVLPSLETIPVEHRLLSDDCELLTLAEILVQSNVAVAEDWEKSGRDATKYLSLSLQRWMREHGVAAIEITSFGTFLSTLCHEYCHHLDFQHFKFTDSWHTRGFYERAGALYHHARGTIPKRLFWVPIKSGRWRIDWPRTNRG